MKRSEIITAFRSQIDDAVVPYLWTDDDVNRYFDDTLNDACERARLIEDSTSIECTRISVRIGVALYNLHESIFFIERAKLDGQPTSLGRTDIYDLDRENDWPVANYGTGAGNWTNASGSPRLFADEGKQIRLVPIPTANDVLRLVVKRRPIAPVADGDEPEIPSNLHVRLIDGMMARAYMRRDGDTYDPQAAQRAEMEFMRYFGERSDINVMRKRRQHRPRTTRYKRYG